MIRRFHRCGHVPGTITTEVQAAVDRFRAMLTAVRPRSPGPPATAMTSPYGWARSSSARTRHR
ncbi:hypothetical protein OG523_00955 [Streptomyces virginiae]|uniref:hypothetical protein n=1 Tax=Streptomyces virginiae TaxID=1961 RepID=UPI002E303BB8|nr:hypothetical protein [Streptomyces virginiae]